MTTYAFNYPLFPQATPCWWPPVIYTKRRIRTLAPKRKVTLNKFVRIARACIVYDPGPWGNETWIVDLKTKKKCRNSKSKGGKRNTHKNMVRKAGKSKKNKNSKKSKNVYKKMRL